MKRFALSLLASLVLLPGAFAQHLDALSSKELKNLDLSGKFVGKRHQYTPDHKAFMQSFEYEFELKQEGDIITGVSTIIKDNGDYADIQLRGVIIADKLYFEEYQIKGQAKDESMVWCLKSGALNIRKDGDVIKLVGSTDSYMADYYIPCTGGYTDLSKMDNSANFTLKGADLKVEDITAGDNVMSISPNPFVDNTKINYTLAADAKVNVEVYDITGRKVAVLENNQSRTAGSYSVDFNAKNYGYSAGIMIAKVTIDGKIYSSQMVQVRN